MAYVTIKDFNTQLQNIGNKTLYTGEDVSLDVENLKKITGNLNKYNFVDFMNALSYQKPDVALTSNLTTLVYEVGTTVNGGQTLTAAVAKGTSPIVKVEFFKDGVSVSAITDSVIDGGNFNYANGLSITTNETYSVIVTCEDGTVVEDSLSIKFYNPYYFGVTSKDLDEITETDISTMIKDVSVKETKEHRYTSNNEKIIFAYDKNYGLLSSVLDENNFEYLDSMEYREITIGTTVFYVYSMKNKCYCTDFKYTFKY